MRSLFASPLRVYVVIGLLAILGIWAGTKLPVSLFPNSSQPNFGISLSYGSMGIDDFRRLYGERLERELAKIQTKELKAEQVSVTYLANRIHANVQFTWSSPPDLAYRETLQIANSVANSLPEEVRQTLNIYQNSGNHSFFSMSFYSPKRGINELYELLKPVFSAELARIHDAEYADLWNPESPQIAIRLKPNSIGSLGISIGEIAYAVRNSLTSQVGGKLDKATIKMNQSVQSLADLKEIPIPKAGGGEVLLSEVASINLETNREQAQSFRTSGVPSLILFASVKQGANVKRMSEDIMETVERLMPQLPQDVQYKKLVDPSEFIRSAIENVLHEVILGSALASLVLFLFIGSLRNVITTAIEIPISIALAFILMWLFDMNMNLFSLAGLALAAGMNVDASVVVMENIFRHTEETKGPLNARARLQLITKAVSEVRLPVLASTAASLVVFVPFVFVSGFSYALLGDLAKAVIFSHGFSALVALILVPTIRLQLMRGEQRKIKAPLEFVLAHGERLYGYTLARLMNRPKASLGMAFAIFCVGALMTNWLLPRLPQEIVGKPETDWLMLFIESQEYNTTPKMEAEVEAIHKLKLSDFSHRIAYTFDQVHNRGSAQILIKLKSKHDLDPLKAELKERFPDKPGTTYRIDTWNPSEFHIPDPEHIKLVISGSNRQDRMIAARDLEQWLQSKKIFDYVNSTPSGTSQTMINLKVDPVLSQRLAAAGAGVSNSSIIESLRVVTEGRWLGDMIYEGKDMPIYLRYPTDTLKTIEDLKGFPISIKGQLVPLKALIDIDRADTSESLYVLDGQAISTVHGRLKDSQKPQASTLQEQWRAELGQWIKDRLPELNLGPISVMFEDPNEELTRSLNQLKTAFFWSIGLILITMILQFGSLAEALLVMIAVPLGLVGAILSLYVFRSTLSINAVLGMILLNGIAVNNSIILVDLAKRLKSQGFSDREACIGAAQKRLRPILITSLTTVLAMLPIALGYGEGGRVLQPLGIAVAGGLWVSMSLTLLLVPTLQAMTMGFRIRRNQRAAAQVVVVGTLIALVAIGMSKDAFSATNAINAGDKISDDSANKTQENLPSDTAAVAVPSNSGKSSEEFWSALASLTEADPDKKQRDHEAAADATEADFLGKSWTPSIRAGMSRGYFSPLDDLSHSSVSAEAYGSLGMNLYAFGRDSHKAELAELIYEGQKLKSTKNLLMAEEASAKRVFDYIAAVQDFNVFQKIHGMRLRLRNVAKEQFARGLLAQQEVDKIELDIASAEISMRGALTNQERSLAELRSLASKFTLEPVWPLKSNILNDPKLLPMSNQTIENQSLDIKLARLAEQEANIRAAISWSDIFPSLDLDARIGRTLEGPNTQFNPNTAQIAVVLSVPLWDRAQNRAAAEASNERHLAAQYATYGAARARQVASQQVWQQFLRERQSILSRERLIEQAVNLYRAGLARFERGLITVNELAGDESRLYNAERDTTGAWHALHTELVELCHGLGLALKTCLTS